MVERLFLAVQRGCLQFVIVVFPDHTHLLFYKPYHVCYHFKKTLLYVMAQILLGYFNADTKNIIVNTCIVCLLENAKFQWKI